MSDGHRWTKRPINPCSGGNAKSNNSATWATYEEALGAVLIYPDMAGIGFMLGDGWVGIDADHCYTVLDGFTELAQSVLDSVPGYAELSPSGEGVKIITRGTIPQSKADGVLGLEVYDRHRFFTVTGHAVPGRINIIPAAPTDLTTFYTRHFGALMPFNDDDLLVYGKRPLPGWPIERVKTEVLVHMSADCHYQEWLEAGMALHHQGEADDDWLKLWDEWSATAPDRYDEGATAVKWETFGEQRMQGRGGIALPTLIWRARLACVAHWRAQIATITDQAQLISAVPTGISRDAILSGADRDVLARELTARIQGVLCL
ncbi:PriCT-2 domain-containing protein [Paraburkholderia kirstenboschensis]|uniref:PriCT-2 domain-containing protein n=2 Tax=Paraburkholderia kirstenboschensis TaxID=1245436 RepID=UPI0019182310|nr:PriCT-2 domain-containing protein [Paraburkholderia kirstenboschensis]